MNFEIVPIIRINNAKKAEEFYLQGLGMTVDWHHQRSPADPSYMQVRKDNLILQLSEYEHHGSFGSMLIVRVADVDSIYAEWRDSMVLTPLGLSDWGSKSFEFTDPFGNRFLVEQPPAS